LVVAALLSPNPFLGLFGVSVAGILSYLLWREREPQAFLFILAFQWFQVFAVILLGVLTGRSIGEEMGGSHFEEATLLSFLGVGVLGLGMKFASRRAAVLDIERIQGLLDSLIVKKLFLAWLFLSVGLLGADQLGYLIPGLRQAFLALDVWKWAVVVLLFMKWLDSREGRIIVVIVLAYEVFVGMLGYFSAFKEVFFILLLAGSGIVALGKQRFVLLSVIALTLLVFAGVWQTIKGDYRIFLSQGERSQTVNVSVSDRIVWLLEAIPDVTPEKVFDGMEEGVERLSYVAFFGHAMEHVPKRAPHTNGKLWKEAVMHPLMPRLLFPNKPVINDSDRTNTYAGVIVAGVSQGTSISIGYMGESYIDFGKWGMFVPIFLWGWVLGICYFWFMRKSVNPLLGLSLSACLLLSNALLLEKSNIKMVGGLASAFLVTAVINHFFGARFWSFFAGAPSGIKISEASSDDGGSV